MKPSSVERLVKTQLLHDQALAILEVMEVEFTERDRALATESDLREVEHRLELKIESLRTELKSDIQGVIRWNFLFWVTQLAAIAGILKFVR